MVAPKHSLGRISGSVSEAKAIARADAERRKEASTILTPNDLQGEYDAYRMLKTTLGGGAHRSLTSDDLAAFRHNAALAGKKFKGGITARQVIDYSLPADRNKARREILRATPSTAVKNQKNNLAVRFITNASGRNGKGRHHVLIEFEAFQTAVNSGAYKPERAAKLMSSDRLRFECTCGRHTFWYRYLATIGNYNAGRAEHGYPKIRNPNLKGIACKHVLRVMAEIEGSAYVNSFLANMIQQSRKQGDKVRVQMSQKQADEILAKQAKRSTGRIDSREERDLHRARLALQKKARSTRSQGINPQFITQGSRKFGHLAKLAEAGSPVSKSAQDALVKMIQDFGLSKEQVITMLKGLNK